MKRWATATSIALLALLLGTYVAAKIHFFTRFDPSNLDGYVMEHWPFWAVLTAIAALFLLVVRLGRLRNGHSGK